MRRSRNDPKDVMATKRALITGITGQDGRFLADLLHGKGYQVFGLLKGQANPRAEVIRREHPFVELVDGDLTDLTSLTDA
jgi:GDPmannose 4,6-dehydratase